MIDVNMHKLDHAHLPSALNQIPTPPKQIYWLGQPLDAWMDQPKVAIVGSRKASVYGREVTTKLATQLARAGVVIISGLAYGIDITAHQAALSAGGTAVAVLATGLDKIYPSAHLNIARQIAQKGTLLTECAPRADIYKSNFVARNRIISALCDVLLITEAGLKSGSLHTARFALDQGKTIMVVPGNITSPGSQGCNNLIKSGAIPITDVRDIFFALKLKPKTIDTKIEIQASEPEKAVYRLIRDGIVAQEALAQKTRLDGPSLSSCLTMLEIAGHIKPAGGGNWVIS